MKGGEPAPKPSKENYSRFIMQGAIAASGSVMSLVDGDGESKTIPYAYCFYRLFEHCSSLTKAPELLATTLADKCYQNMFCGCTNLTKAPELPATTLATSCYVRMFSGCENLAKAPELPATTLAKNCYESMFQNCTNLTQAPELPATVLEYGCYIEMFRHCTSLTKAPELPATTLVDCCYAYMFNGCSNLAYIKVALTNWGDELTTFFWVENVAKNGTFFCPEELILIYGDNFIPGGWDVNCLETRTEAVPAEEGLSVRTSGLTIFIGNANADIEVYEAGGKLIGKARTMSGEAQMTVPQSGIYLVKAGAQTCKVVL